MRTLEPTDIKYFEEYVRPINLRKSKKVNNAFNDDIFEFGGTRKLSLSFKKEWQESVQTIIMC